MTSTKSKESQLKLPWKCLLKSWPIIAALIRNFPSKQQPHLSVTNLVKR